MNGLPFHPHGMNPFLWALVYLPSLFFFYVGKVYLSAFVWIFTPRMSKRKLRRPFLKRPSSAKRTLQRREDGPEGKPSEGKASSKPPSWWFKVARYQMDEERRKK